MKKRKKEISQASYSLNTVLPSLSISLPSWVPRPAASSSLVQAWASRALTASSAALTSMPHFSYMLMAWPASSPVHLGTKVAANRGLPACRIWL